MAALVFEGCIGNEPTAAELRRVVVSFLVVTLREGVWCIRGSNVATRGPSEGDGWGRTKRWRTDAFYSEP